MQIYQNTDFYFFRKPHWIASTFGKEKSFLDYYFLQNNDIELDLISHKDIDIITKKYIDDQIKSLSIELIQNFDLYPEIIQNLINIFWKEKEFWLLNRLDNDTWWLLYFAKTPEIYDEYRLKQDNNSFTKYYIAQSGWNPFYKSDKKEININHPIMHHRFNEDRMVCLKNPLDEKKWTGKQHMLETKVSLLSFDPQNNISTLLVSISKWIRHQIRVHLSSIWCPIIWESIYSNTKHTNFLHLRSVWFK